MDSDIPDKTDIDCFYNSSFRSENGKINNIRENIILHLFNNTIPFDYYKNQITNNQINKKWQLLHDKLINYFKKNFEIDKYKYCKLEKKGGCGYNYDFKLFMANNSRYRNKKEYNIEFKFNNNNNKTKIKQLSQLIDMKPNKVINYEITYEEYYYRYLLQLCNEFIDLQIPEKELYLSQVNNTNVKCMNEIKSKYKTDNKLKTKIKSLVKLSIENYIKKESTNVNIKEFEKHIQNSQHNKHYCIYSKTKKTFNYDYINFNDWKINKIEKTKQGFICYSDNVNLSITYAWKNTSGIANPYIKIKIYKPKKITIKQLKELCDNNCINYSKKITKRKDFIELLNKNGHNVC